MVGRQAGRAGAGPPSASGCGFLSLRARGRPRRGRAPPRGQASLSQAPSGPKMAPSRHPPERAFPPPLRGRHFCHSPRSERASEPAASSASTSAATGTSTPGPFSRSAPLPFFSSPARSHLVRPRLSRERRRQSRRAGFGEKKKSLGA